MDNGKDGNLALHFPSGEKTSTELRIDPPSKPPASIATSLLFPFFTWSASMNGWIQNQFDHNGLDVTKVSVLIWCFILLLPKARVGNVKRDPNELLTHKRYTKMKNWYTNTFLMQTTSNCFWASEFWKNWGF